MRAGDIVSKRSIYRGAVRWTFPHRVVGEWNGRIGIYCGPGNPGKAMRREPGVGYLERWRQPDRPPYDTTWQGTHVLRFEGAGARHTVEVWWIGDWEFGGWYLNLRTPTSIGERFIDTTDQALDVSSRRIGRRRGRTRTSSPRRSTSASGRPTRPRTSARPASGQSRSARGRPAGRTGGPPADWGPLGLPRDWHVV